MGERCCGPATPRNGLDERYRRVLVAALLINGVMFVGELAGGLASGSVSLLADSLDFLGDAGNYGISLLVLGESLRHRAKVALVKGVTMGMFGLWVLGSAGRHLAHGTFPDAQTMSVVGLLGLAANLAVFGMLWAYRGGDSNMRSVWICSRNDVAGNAAVLLAAAGVFGTRQGWPDAIVAAVMALLALQGAVHVIRLAATELRTRSARPTDRQRQGVEHTQSA